MTQFARPNSDIDHGTWTTTPLYPKINQVTYNDSSFISSVPNPDPASFTCGLTAIAPPSQTPSYIVSVRLQRTEDDPDHPGWTLIELLEGTRTVAAKLVQAPLGGFVTELLHLTQSEINSMTNYADLRVCVTAGVPVTVSCLNCPIAPRQWKLSVAGITNGTCENCDSLNGNFTLVYAGGCVWQTASYSACDYHFRTWALYPRSDKWLLSADTGPAGLGQVTYSIPIASFRCLAVNQFSFDNVSGSCSSFPSKLIIVPSFS